MRLPFRVWELNQRHNYHPQAARTAGNLLEKETKRREQTISDFHGKACWRLSINRLIYRFPRAGRCGKKWENREGWWGEEKGKKQLEVDELRHQKPLARRPPFPSWARSLFNRQE